MISMLTRQLTPFSESQNDVQTCWSARLVYASVWYRSLNDAETFPRLESTAPADAYRATRNSKTLHCVCHALRLLRGVA